MRPTHNINRFHSFNMYHKIEKSAKSWFKLFQFSAPLGQKRIENLKYSHTLRDVILLSFVLWFSFRIIWDKRNCNWLINHSNRWNISVTYELFGVELECSMQSAMTNYAVNPFIPMLRFPDFTRGTLKRQYFDSWHSYLRAGDKEH